MLGVNTRKNEWVNIFCTNEKERTSLTYLAHRGARIVQSSKGLAGKQVRNPTLLGTLSLETMGGLTRTFSAKPRLNSGKTSDLWNSSVEDRHSWGEGTSAKGQKEL